MGLPAEHRARFEEERARRQRRSVFRPELLCFAPQLAFVRDPARFKVACCSRRAGKTVAAAVILLLSALAKADTINLYIHIARVSGKRIVWRTLCRLNREYGLGGEVNRSELSLTFPNGSQILVAGAKDESEIEKLRGLSRVDLAVIDEAQSFREHIEQLVDDVIMPALMDTQGSLVLIGTPGRVRSGFFYEAVRWANPALLAALNAEPVNDNAQAEEDEDAPEVEWSVHHWTVRDNPHIPDVEDELARIRRRKRWSEDHPTYQREYLGRWVTEHDALVYKYDPERNSYDPATETPDISSGPWQFVHFVDQGFNDADAHGTLAWRKDRPWVWLLPDEVVLRRQGAHALVLAARDRWENPQYKGRALAMVWDEGGGGKKVAEDARKLYGVPVTPAEKPEKVAGVDLVNEWLRLGILKVPRNSQAAVDAARVTWDPKAPGVRIGGKYHTDIWDGILYGCRKIPKGAFCTLEAWEAAQKPVPDEVKALAESKARIAARVQSAQQQKLNRFGLKKARPGRLFR